MSEVFLPSSKRDTQEQRQSANRTRLLKNEALKSLSKLVSKTPPDWDFLAQEMQRRRLVKNHNLPGTCGEIHIEGILKKTDILGEATNTLKDISSGEKTAQYRFRQDREGKLFIVERAGRDDIAEYDHITNTDGLTVVWESKLTQKAHSTHGGLHSVLKENHIERIFTPLQQYFDTNEFGYVVISAPEALYRKSQVQSNFRKRGGILLPFPMKLADFREQVFKTAENNNLPRHRDFL